MIYQELYLYRIAERVASEVELLIANLKSEIRILKLVTMRREEGTRHKPFSRKKYFNRFPIVNIAHSRETIITFENIFKSIKNEPPIEKKIARMLAHLPWRLLRLAREFNLRSVG